jgi:hypothetical protein
VTKNNAREREEIEVKDGPKRAAAPGGAPREAGLKETGVVEPLWRILDLEFLSLKIGYAYFPASAPRNVWPSPFK